MNETDATSSPTQAAAATAAVAVAVAVVPTTPKTPKTPTSPTTPTVITIPKLLPKIKLPLMKKSSSERLRELQALENIKKLHQQQPSQPQPNPLRKQLKKQEVTTKPDSPDEEQETSLIIDNNNKMTEPTEKQQTDKKTTTLKKFDRKESDNRIIVVEEYASIVVTDSDEKDEKESSTTNGETNSNSKQPEEMANFMCEFDEFVFSSDVATPALEEPEVFDINGSSTSLINTPTTAIPTIRIEGEQANSPSSSLLDNTADNNGANNSRAREYKVIHSMFAKKSRLDNNNNNSKK